MNGRENNNRNLGENGNITVQSGDGEKVVALGRLPGFCGQSCGLSDHRVVPCRQEQTTANHRGISHGRQVTQIILMLSNGFGRLAILVIVFCLSFVLSVETV